MITNTMTPYGENIIVTGTGRRAGTIHQGAGGHWFANPRGSAMQCLPCQDQEDAHQTVLRLACNMFGEPVL